MMKSTVLFAVLLLLLPLASGSEAERLTAEDLEVRSGTVTGDVAVLKLLAQAGQRPSPLFNIDAESLRLEVDHARALEVVQRTYVSPTTSASHHAAASVEGLANDAEARWTLDPWPGHDAPTVEVQTACLELHPAARPVETTRAVVHNTEKRPDRLTDLSNTTRPERCIGTSATEAVIRGDWRLSVWDWSFQVTDQEGTRMVETGLQPRMDGVGSDAREAFLFVTSGVLRVPLDDPSAFYLAAARVVGEEVVLHGASGTLPTEAGLRMFDDEDATLYGVEGLRITGRGVGEDLGVSAPTMVALSPATQAPESPLQAPPTVAALAGTVLAVIAGVFVRCRPLFVEARHRRGGSDLGTRPPRTLQERRGLGYRFLARAAHRARRHHIALHYARRAHALFPAQPEVRLMLATALSHLGRDAEALVHYVVAAGMMPEHERPLRARAVLGIAVSNAGLGELDSAVAAFERLVSLDRELATERLGAPSLLALDDHPRFQELRHRLELLRGVPDDQLRGSMPRRGGIDVA